MSSERSVSHRSIDTIRAETEQEIQRVERELAELDRALRQGKGETGSLVRRDQQLANRVHEIEANLENYSREEIREVYEAAREFQTHMFVMRSRTEQAEQKRKALVEYRQQLERMLERLHTSAARPEDLPMAEAPAAEGAGETPQAVMRIIDAQEEERQTLARHMQDGPATVLSNLILQTEIVERLLNTDRGQARTEMAALRTAMNEAFQQTREFIFNLRPLVLDELGLFPTLRRFVEDFEVKAKIPTRLTITGQDRRLPTHLEVAVFRIIQELLKNIHQHSGATAARLAIDVSETRLKVTVEDNGGGFDVPEVLAQVPARRTQGIGKILERVNMLRGEIRLESNPGRGTHIYLTLPASV